MEKPFRLANLAPVACLIQGQCKTWVTYLFKDLVEV
jgi:hypothetical protein